MDRTDPGPTPDPTPDPTPAPEPAPEPTVLERGAGHSVIWPQGGAR
ncbi:hypothetical protein ACIQI7_38580 [Kitasatospora sp. NPDC092039]